MNRTRLLLLVGLAACDRVFGLEPPADAPPADARVVIDVPPGSCRTASDPDFHDEDGDGIEDSCDRCPTVAGPDTEDSDGDGVPNECDPDVNAQNYIVLFDPFVGKSELLTRYRASGGDWREGGDALVFSDDSDTAHRLVSVVPMPPGTVTMVATLVLERMRNPLSLVELGVEFMAARAITCGARHGVASGDNLVIANDYTLASKPQSVGAHQIGAEYIVRFAYVPNAANATVESQCSANAPTTIHHQVGQAYVMPDGSPGGMGLVARNIAVRVNSIIVYGTR